MTCCHCSPPRCPCIPQPILQLHGVYEMAARGKPGPKRDTALSLLMQAERALQELFAPESCHHR